MCVCVWDPGPQNQSEVSIFQNWNLYIIWKLNKTQGVKTFEQNEDVYIFPVLPKYHIFSFSTALQKLQKILTCFPDDKLS